MPERRLGDVPVGDRPLCGEFQITTYSFFYTIFIVIVCNLLYSPGSDTTILFPFSRRASSSESQPIPPPSRSAPRAGPLGVQRTSLPVDPDPTPDRIQVAILERGVHSAGSYYVQRVGWTVLPVSTRIPVVGLVIIWLGVGCCGVSGGGVFRRSWVCGLQLRNDPIKVLRTVH